MVAMIELLQDGGVTSAKGFTAGGTYAGLKTQEEGVLDLGVLLSETPARLGTTSVASCEKPCFCNSFASSVFCSLLSGLRSEPAHEVELGGVRGIARPVCETV